MDLYKQLSSDDIKLESRFSSLISIIESNGISVVDLLTCASNDTKGLSQLSKRVGRSIREVEEYLNYLSESFDDAVTPNRLSVNEESEDLVPNFVSSGLPSLDQQLHGGIPIGDITEVFGESGCGKSHFLLQLSIQAQLVGNPAKNQSVYISTESPIETRRLESMLENYNIEGVSMDNISSIYCQDLESQDHIIFTQLPVKLEQESNNIRLVVIDSIAHHLRREDAISNSTFLVDKIREQESKFEDDKFYKDVKETHSQLMKAFFKSNEKYENRMLKLHYLLLLHRHLLKLASKHNIAIVLANQVSDHTTTKIDFNLFEEGFTMLDFDVQLGYYSGWDNETIYKYQQALGKTDSVVNTTDAHKIHTQLVDSINQAKIGSKRARMTADLNFDPRYKNITDENNESSEEFYTNQKKLLSDLHYSTNAETKRLVPTLGHHWSKHMVSRIMIMKTYKPIIKDKSDLVSEQSVDSETGMTYNDICEGFDSKVTQSSKRSYSQKSFNTLESILKGWRVQRFINAVASPYDFNGTNNNRKIEFRISKHGIMQI